MENGEVKISLEDGVATLAFSHPRSNSLPGALLREIARQIEKLGADERAGIILLKSAGERTFCGGASFEEMQSVKNREEGRVFFSGFAKIFLAIRDCPKFVITRVHGKTVGGGVGIIAASDYVLAVESASIRLSEFALGFGPFVIGEVVRRKLGVAAFNHLAIGCGWESAAWAREKGLYNELFPSIEELDSGVEALTKRLAASNPAAQRQLKSMLWKGSEDWERIFEERASISAELILSDFVQAEIAKVSS